jgi:hypothetical protein
VILENFFGVLFGEPAKEEIQVDHRMDLRIGE